MNSAEEHSILSKGLIFVPTTRFDNFGWVKDLNLFIRRLKWAMFFNKKNKRECQAYGLEQNDWEGFKTLESLWAGSNRELEEGPFTSFHTKSRKNPLRKHFLV